MKRNFVKMVCGSLVLFMVTSISCASKGPDKGAKGDKVTGPVTEGAAPPEAKDKDQKGQAQPTPNVSVNVTQINTTERRDSSEK